MHCAADDKTIERDTVLSFFHGKECEAYKRQQCHTKKGDLYSSGIALIPSSDSTVVIYAAKNPPPNTSRWTPCYKPVTPSLGSHANLKKPTLLCSR
jgi:hypothetical protein